MKERINQYIEERIGSLPVEEQKGVRDCLFTIQTMIRDYPAGEALMAINLFMYCLLRETQQTHQGGGEKVPPLVH